MPKIYEYLGMVLLFWSDEHKPIHVHAISSDKRECKVIFHVKKSKITKIVYQDVKGKKSLTLPQMKKLKKLVKQEKYQIINAWIKVFILGDVIKVRKITKKIK